MKRYKIDKKIFSVLIASSITFLPSCDKQEDYSLQVRQKDCLSFIVNPFDWSYNPDTVYLKFFDDDVYMFMYPVDEFFLMLDSDVEYLCFEKGGKIFEINRLELKCLTQKYYKNITSSESICTCKIVMLFAEGVCLVPLIPASYEKVKKIL